MARHKATDPGRPAAAELATDARPLRPALPRRRKQRADVLLVEQGLAESRAKAQALLLAGRVLHGETRVDKPGTLLPGDAHLRLSSAPRFVSRGGDKLDHALAAFAAHGLVTTGRVCLDIGAATGGFTDCLLQRGARVVHAVDVGHGQLHPKLRADPRVVAREGVNARQLGRGDFPEPVELVVVDASFIGLGQLAPAIRAVLGAGGELVALMKPQFEAGREAASRGRGVIRDEAVREQALESARSALRAVGFELLAEVDSPIRGPKGNLERLVYARLHAGREPARSCH